MTEETTPGIDDIKRVQRAAEDRRHASEAGAWLAAIVENSDDAILSKTLDGIIMTWNRGAERLFGYTAAEAVGKHITLVIPKSVIMRKTRYCAGCEPVSGSTISRRCAAVRMARSSRCR